MKSYTSKKAIEGLHEVLLVWNGRNQKGKGRVVNNSERTIVYMDDEYPINDDFAIEFAEFCINNKWDKISASLGIDDDGKNIAKNTRELMDEFLKIKSNINLEKKYLEKRKWFLDRVGKIVYRCEVNCKCEFCKDGTDNGVFITDRNHACYLTDISCELGIKYFDTKPIRVDGF